MKKQGWFRTIASKLYELIISKIFGQTWRIKSDQSRGPGRVMLKEQNKLIKSIR